MVEQIGAGWGAATAIQLRSEPPLPRLMAGATLLPPLGRKPCLVKRMVAPVVRTAMSIRAFTGTLAEALPILGLSGQGQ